MIAMFGKMSDAWKVEGIHKHASDEPMPQHKDIKLSCGKVYPQSIMDVLTPKRQHTYWMGIRMKKSITQ